MCVVESGSVVVVVRGKGWLIGLFAVLGCVSLLCVLVKYKGHFLYLGTCSVWSYLQVHLAEAWGDFSVLSSCTFAIMCDLISLFFLGDFARCCSGWF